ncbi:DUF1289 domain-containing protein [Paraburkholderia sp. PGU16]|jgi:predicted Fe-S protein YdhL (DUF1289 family)|uniref:DUF1289 domain-containing protein n=1 Tax=Paraburkholderia largidicola TaxID=3014751 RepID=A0A7I8BF44_9BURK|nr:DUF1289 domain-containing protein [Paraburkholderia sp. PGU16]BCF87147.1 hypothetical protein PPGU16_02140 [Paraburkholderia sp. PGU16]BEU20057.1 DUF1289 domain-containing protein [Paraburkholderia sp. 22B1P]
MTADAARAQDAAQAIAPVPSPCINVCRMNRSTGLCEGCLRTIDEIANWSSFDDAAKRAVWDEIDRRHVDFMAKQSPNRETNT